MRFKGEVPAVSFEPMKTAFFALPALCYFISNNCMFVIIRELGPTTFQIMNNLKVLATGVLMHVFLGRKLTWIRWKALLMLVLGSCVTQLRTEEEPSGSELGYILVVVNSFVSGAGGVISDIAQGG